MHPIRPSLRPLVALAVAGSLALSACNRDEARTADDAATPPPSSAPASPPPAAPMPASPEIRVTSLELGNSVDAGNRVQAPGSTFAPGDTVHASVVTEGDGGGVTARWLFEDGQVVDTTDKKVPAGAQVTSFMVTNPDGWPVGRYTVEVLVDGQVVQTREFEVR